MERELGRQLRLMEIQVRHQPTLQAPDFRKLIRAVRRAIEFASLAMPPDISPPVRIQQCWWD
jgi:hypothetical protein